MKTKNNRRGFTLVELLVVIGIIAVLAALLLPAVRSSIDKAERTQAQVDVKNIKAAIQAFYNDYGKLPAVNAGASDDSLFTGSQSAEIVKALTGENQTLNPKNFAYLESKTNVSSSVNYPDPWDKQYGIKLDLNYDNEIKFKGINFKTAVIVVSGGPDEQISDTSGDGDGKDDIHSSQ